MAIAPTGSSASFVVTPAGNAAWPSIGLPAASPWFELTLLPEQDDLGPTSTITFTGTASFVVLTDHTGGV
jgi:hypothetical protein